MSFTTSHNEQHISYFYLRFLFSILKFYACDENIMTLGSAESIWPDKFVLKVTQGSLEKKNQ